MACYGTKKATIYYNGKQIFMPLYGDSEMVEIEVPEIEEPEVPLTAPTISLSGNTLSIVGDSNTELYVILVDGYEETTVSNTSFDLSTLDLSEGTHTVTVKARASGYEDSPASNAVSYVVQALIPTEGLEYTLSADGTHYICSGIGTATDTDIIIADAIDGIPVTSIDRFAFDNCDSLRNVVIGDSVTSIGSYAFGYCTSLTSIEIPNSVTSIGGSAFSNCDSLTSVEIPNSVTSIGDEAFRDCDSLTSITVSENNTAYQSIDGNLYTKDGKTLIQYVIGKTATSFTIPQSVTSIGSSAFWGCDSLTSIEIPNSVTSIGGSAFGYCTSLTSVEIPNSVTSIDGMVFSGCTSLTSITFNGTVTQWSAISKNNSWHSVVPATYVQCTDGTVSI
jgi:hypothetical protein